MADRPEAANGVIKVLRAMYDVAVERGLMTHNPAALVKLLPTKNPDGFHGWTLDEQKQFKAHHPVGTTARLAYELLFETGQRRADIVRLRPADGAGWQIALHADQERQPQAGAHGPADRADTTGDNRRHADRSGDVSGYRVWQAFYVQRVRQPVSRLV